MLAKESRVSKGLEFEGGGGRVCPGRDLACCHLAQTRHLHYLHWNSFSLWCNVFILVRTLTALLRESKKVTSEESTHLTGSPAVNSGPDLRNHLDSCCLSSWWKQNFRQRLALWNAFDRRNKFIVSDPMTAVGGLRLNLKE